MRLTGLTLPALFAVMALVGPTDGREPIQAMPPYMSHDRASYEMVATHRNPSDVLPPTEEGYRSGGQAGPGYPVQASSSGPAFAPNVPPPPGMVPQPAMPYGPAPADGNAIPATASGLAPQSGSAFGSPHETPPWGDSTPAQPTSGLPPAADTLPMHSSFAPSTDTYSASPFWTWQVAPDGIIYKSYLAGGREPRMGSQWFHDRDLGWLWDSTLGGRVGLVRYGTTDTAWPEGWQLDFEGAAFPRLDLENDRDLVSVDFRFGMPLTFRRGPWEWKFGYYHLCSHIGDEYLERHEDAARINFVRDAIILGLALRPHPDLRLYAEAGYAPWVDGGSEPWEFQFGVDYSPIEPSGFRGAPFLAANGRIRQEVDFGGNFTVQTGWQWRGDTGNLLRFGAHYFNGMSDQYQFFRSFEEHIGMGLWYDF